MGNTGKHVTGTEKCRGTHITVYSSRIAMVTDNGRVFRKLYVCSKLRDEPACMYKNIKSFLKQAILY